MAITLATDSQNSASAYKNISIEDYLDLLDRIDPAQTPMLAMSDNEIALGSTEFAKNVDSFPVPKGALGVADGNAAATANTVNVISAVRKIGNIAQGFREQYGAGWIAQHVPKVAGVKDLTSYGKMKAQVQLKRQVECAIESLDQIAVADAGGNLGAIGAGYYNLVASANAYAATAGFSHGKPSDLHFAPANAVVSGTIAGNFSRAALKTVALALRTAAQQSGDWTLLAGLTLRQAITDLTNPVTVTSTVTGGAVSQASEQVRVLLRNESDSTLGATVDVVQTDFGRFLVKETDYIGTTTGTAALTSWSTVSASRVAAVFSGRPTAGLIVRRGNIFKRWAIPPYTVKLGESGKGDEYDTKQLLAWGVRNPILAGALNFTA